MLFKSKLTDTGRSQKLAMLKVLRWAVNVVYREFSIQCLDIVSCSIVFRISDALMLV